MLVLLQRMSQLLLLEIIALFHLLCVRNVPVCCLDCRFCMVFSEVPFMSELNPEYLKVVKCLEILRGTCFRDYELFLIGMLNDIR